MSNLADLLNAWGLKDSRAVEEIGAAIGIVADASGVVGAVVGIVDLFVKHDDPDIAQKLDAIKTEIQQGFATLQQESRAQQLLDRWAGLDPAAAQAQAVIDQLPDVLRQSPPISKELQLEQIGKCLEAVEQLNQDDKWLTVFDLEIYYGQDPSHPSPALSDYWTGVVAPVPNPDGTAFSDRFILPLFLRSLYVFMLVAAAFEPDYAAQYVVPLKRFTQRLQSVHDTSVNGLVTIRRPQVPPANWDGSTYFPQWQDWQDGFDDQAPAPTKDGLSGRGGNNWPFQEYGVIHTFTGYNNISYFPKFTYKSAVDRAPVPIVVAPDFYARLNLGIKRNWKQAYIDLGLSSVRKTIDVLHKLVGDPPLSGHDPGAGWGLREIHEALGDGFLDPGQARSPHVSLADVVHRLRKAGGPLPTPGPLGPPPVDSWRKSLDAALDSATIAIQPAPN